MDLKIKFKSKKEFLNKNDTIKLTQWLNSDENEFYLEK